MKTLPSPLPKLLYRVSWSKVNAWKPGEPVDFVERCELRAYDVLPGASIPTMEIMNVTAYLDASRAGKGMAFAKNFIYRTGDLEDYYLTPMEALTAHREEINEGIVGIQRQIQKLQADKARFEKMWKALGNPSPAPR